MSHWVVLRPLVIFFLFSREPLFQPSGDAGKFQQNPNQQDDDYDEWQLNVHFSRFRWECFFQREDGKHPRRFVPSFWMLLQRLYYYIFELFTRHFIWYREDWFAAYRSEDQTVSDAFDIAEAEA